MVNHIAPGKPAALSTDVHIAYLQKQLASGHETRDPAAFAKAEPGLAQHIAYSAPDRMTAARKAQAEFPIHQAEKYPTAAFLFHYGAPADKQAARATLGLKLKTSAPPAKQPATIQGSLENAHHPSPSVQSPSESHAKPSMSSITA